MNQDMHRNQAMSMKGVMWILGGGALFALGLAAAVLILLSIFI